MRTSYRRSHSLEDNEIQKVQQQVREVQEDNEVGEEEQVSQNETADQIERTFLEEESIKAYKDIIQKANPDTDVDSIVNQAESEVSEEKKKKQEKKDEEKKKSHKKCMIIGFSIIGVIIAIIASFFIYFKFLHQDNSVEAISQRVEKLYTSPNKVDIKNGVTQTDLNDFYTDLSEAAKNGENTKSVESEIDTIGYFLSDKEQLNEYNSEDFDLTTVGMTDSLKTINENTDAYTVPGLAVTITNLSNQIQSDYDNFIALRSELQGVTDVLTFDANAYKSRINEITHNPNKEELNAIYDKIVADQNTAKAEEELKAAATEEAKAQAEQALEEAKRVQQDTQQKLEDAQAELAENAKEAADSLKSALFGDSSEGSSELTGSSNSSDSTNETEEGVSTQSTDNMK